MSTTHRLTGEERRAAIVEAALRIFADKGFRGATTRELAVAVGVSEPVLYQHFATKRDLYAAIIEAKSQDAAVRVAEYLTPFIATDDDPGFFLRMAEMILDWYTEDPSYIRLLLYSELEGHELADLFHERATRAFLAVVTPYVERRIARGAFRNVDASLVVHAFAGMVANYGQQCAISPRSELNMDRKAVARGMADLFLQGLRS